MRTAYVPPVLWRVAITYPNGKKYGSPTSGTYSDEMQALAARDRAKRHGAEVRIYRAEPKWEDVTDREVSTWQ